VRIVAPGTRITLGFDGSLARDTTAIVGCTLDPIPHLFVIGVWEKPDGAGPEWRVPVLEVEDRLRWAFQTYEVVRAGFDPAFWQRSLQTLEAEGVSVIETFPPTPDRMVPACGVFYDRVVNGGLTHDGDARLLRHTAHCVVKTDARGQRVTKDYKDSPRKIDIAMAAIIAVYLAFLVTQENAAGWDFFTTPLPGLWPSRTPDVDGFMPIT
jgi:hypothetical protein